MCDCEGDGGGLSLLWNYNQDLYDKCNIFFVQLKKNNELQSK